MFAGRVTSAGKGWTTLQKLDQLVKYISTAKCCQEKKVILDTRWGRFAFRNGSSRKLHDTTNLGTLEIRHAHSVLQNSEAYSESVANYLTAKTDLQVDDIEHLIDKQWSSMSIAEMLNNFEALSCYTYKNQILSENRYYGILQVLTNGVKDFTNKDILHMLNCLVLWPGTNKNEPMHPQIYNLLKAVDIQCLKRLNSWNINEVFLINDLFFKLRFLKLSLFTPRSLALLNPYDLTSANLIQLLFLMKVHGKIKISLNNLETQLLKHFDKFTMDELGIISMAFFKYQTRIKSQQLIIRMMQELKENIRSVNDVTLSAILKVLRYSINLNLINQFSVLLQSLVSEVPHRSLQSVTHIAHLQGNSLIHYKELILKILDRYENEIDKARLKDIERIAFTLYIFNYEPKDTNFYSTASRNLLDPSRVKEIEKFPKSLVYTVMYMLQANYYHEESVKYVMDPKFIEKISNGDIKNLHREYLILDYCIEIDHPEYNGPRINKNVLNYLKKYGAFYKTPLSKDHKVDQANKLVTDITYTCRKLLNSEEFVYIDSLLPHIAKTYIILCYDPRTKNYVFPGNHLSQISAGSIKYAPKDGNQWYALVVGSHNIMTRDDNSPTGALTVQMRHLKSIGYTPILISYFDWLHLKSDWSKSNFIAKILKT